MYKNLQYGASNGSYNITNLNTALKRQELAHCLLIPIPGPKMLYQFGELGYDYSINTCSDGVTISNDCRTSAKPVRWDYWDNQNRKHLYKVTAALNNLKKNEPIFSTTNFNIDLGGFGKRIHLNGTNNAVVVGNFQTTSLNMIPGFQHTGTWYDYFTGNSFQVNDLGATFFYEPGEYHVYTDYQLAIPDLNTSLSEVMSFAKSTFMIWPNPSSHSVNLAYSMSQAAKVQIVLRDLTGRVVTSFNTQGVSGINQSEWNLAEENIAAGSYIISVETEGRRESAPFIWNP
jgi:hypothetical protein